MGYVALTPHLQPSNYIASVIKGSSTYLAMDLNHYMYSRPLSIEAARHIDNCSCPRPTFVTSWPFRTTIVSAVYIRQPVASNPTQSRWLRIQLLLVDRTAAVWAINRSAHTINVVRPVH